MDPTASNNNQSSPKEAMEEEKVPISNNSNKNKNDEGEDDGDNKSDADSDLGDEKLASSEIDPLQVCLQGLDSFSQEKDLAKFLQSKFEPPIRAESIVKKKGKSYAFIAFATVEEKARFEKAARGMKYKNKKIKVRPVNINTHSLKFEKKVKKIEEEMQTPKTIPRASEEEIKLEMAKPIQEKVCPLWKTPYEEQILKKKAELTEVLKTIKTKALETLKKEDSGFIPVQKWLTEESGPLACPLTEFLPAEESHRFYYRNKAELTIGEAYNKPGEIVIGFNKGQFSKGYMYVESGAECPVISKEAIELAGILEAYLNKSGLEAYDRLKHSGVWRSFVVRQSEKFKDMLINIVVHKGNIKPPERFEEIKTELVNLFKDYNTNGYKISSILLQEHEGVADNIPYDTPVHKLLGEDYYHDEILGYKFRVSSNAFLQVNSSSCEKLYSLIKKVSAVDKDTVFLDICSGIGTIGICCAAEAKKIVGVEIIDKAVKDSDFNAKLNGLENTEYFAGKVESLIKDVIKPYAGNSKIVGVVDPPRAGLHKDVVTALRTCKGLDNLIYVACNPEGVVGNLLDLCLPATKRRKAPPFVLKEAYGVDLFPQTEHFEGLFVLKRV